ncbi:MAG: LysM peptidoglycan-binding domain-containing protein [Leptolyngbya sp. DLM2.Bin27]|nr:MAG: LysM peptidoglycan-binding domain-containing protein [Leptolyngbya sp. DLM2.Bin27]
MLGLALSFGASAPFLTEPELALAADGSTLIVLPAANRDQAQGLKLTSTKAQSSSYHTVEAGESLWQIAAQHEADVQAIKVANSIATDDVIRVGQVIRVPAVGMANLATAADDARLSMQVNVLGGVGGDRVATSSLLAPGVLPSVNHLEKDGELDETLDALDLEAVDELAEQDPMVDQAERLEETAVSESTQLDIVQLAAIPTIEQPSSTAQDQAVWSVAQAAEANQPIAQVEPSESADAAVSMASLPLHGASEPTMATGTSPQAQPPAASATASEAAESKKDLIATAALPLRSFDRETAVEIGTSRSYQVKPGDTLWSIASRNGVTLDQLLSHNHAVSRPEALAVGDNLSIPVAAAAAEPELVAPAADLAAVHPTREDVIRDHLARIRESNGTLVDRDELNARIREARQALERSRSGSPSAPMAMEYHSPEPVAIASGAIDGVEPASETALTVREGAQSVATQWTITDVAEAEPQQVAAVQPASSVERPASVESVALPNQLLAAAPLGAEAYRAMPNTPVGQTVSPNMPMMPGASDFLPEAPALSAGYIWPTQGVLTSGYGWRWGRMHRGIDIAGPVGTPIVAAASGQVIRSGWNSGGYGNLVDIRHPDGSMTRYAHNSRLLVRAGEQVRQGQQIAEMGSTGYSTGPHLHFEVHLAGGTANPMAFLPRR